MIILDPGHSYKLDELDGGFGQDLYFVKREGSKYPGNKGHHPGTTTQEVLRALIDRAEYVNSQDPCAETESVGNLLRGALLLLEMRAARRRGSSISFGTIQEFENAPTEKDGHVR